MGIDCIYNTLKNNRLNFLWYLLYLENIKTSHVLKFLVLFRRDFLRERPPGGIYCLDCAAVVGFDSRNTNSPSKQNAKQSQASEVTKRAVELRRRHLHTPEDLCFLRSSGQKRTSSPDKAEEESVSI